MLSVIGVTIAHLVGVIDVDVESVDATLWLELVVIAGVGIFVQAGAEELFFRGYLTQAVRRFTSQPAVFLLIPAMLFAAPHLTNLTQFDSSPYVLLPYLIDGLAFGWVAYRTGSLWMSLGIHWSNNLSNVVLVGPRGDVLDSVAPLQFDIPNSIAELTTISVVTSLAMVAIVEVALRRTGRHTPGAGLAK